MSWDYISDHVDLAPYSLEGPGNFMSEDSALKLADTLSIATAACCIVGISPSLMFHKNGRDFHLTIGDINHLPIGDINTDAPLPQAQTHTVVDAICNAITTGKLKAAHIECPNVNGISESLLDIWDTLIDIDELKRWLLSRNCKPPFFFGADASNTPDYLEPEHPNFSLDIAAAIQVWEAIQDPELRKGKSAKAAATEWLKTHYRALGLVHNGQRNNNAIERIATLVNWETSGGAPKTPG